jgi:hypothetical protein
MRVGDDVSESDVEQWLDNDDGDPCYKIQSHEEIGESVLQGKKEDEDVHEEDKVTEEESTSSCPKLSVIRNHMDDVILYIGASSDSEVLAYYWHFRQFCSVIIKK